jgi:hypothetical protein
MEPILKRPVSFEKGKTGLLQKVLDRSEFRQAQDLAPVESASRIALRLADPVAFAGFSLAECGLERVYFALISKEPFMTLMSMFKSKLFLNFREAFFALAAFAFVLGTLLTPMTLLAAEPQPLPIFKDHLSLAVQSAQFYQGRIFLVQQGRVFKSAGSLRPQTDYCEALVTKVLPLGTEFHVRVDFLADAEVDFTNLQAGVQLKCHQLQRPAVWTVEEVQAILTDLVTVIPK